MSDVVLVELEQDVKCIRTLAGALENFQSGLFPRGPTVTWNDWHPAGYAWRVGDGDPHIFLTERLSDKPRIRPP